MNQIGFWIKDWLPPKLHEELRRVRAWLEFSMYKRKDILSGNNALKSISKGKRAFLIATGPSLKKEDLSVLAGEDCYGISNFFLHENIKSIKPRFHFFAPYHEPVVLDSYLNWLEEADRTLPPETNIFMGHTTYDLVRKKGLFRTRKIAFLYLSQYPSANWLDLTKPVLAPQSGPLMALPVLLYMGYKEIYLLGCDHTEMRDYKKKVNNFFDAAKDLRRTTSDDYQVWDNGVVKNLRDTANAFEQYLFYKKMLSEHDAKIINLSQDSWLDCFPFNTLENVTKAV